MQIFLFKSYFEIKSVGMVNMFYFYFLTISLKKSWCFTLNGPSEQFATERAEVETSWSGSHVKVDLGICDWRWWAFEEFSRGSFEGSLQAAVQESRTDLKIEVRISDKRLSISDWNFRDSFETNPNGCIGAKVGMITAISYTCDMLKLITIWFKVKSCWFG